MGLNAGQQENVQKILKSHGYTDYKWIDPKKRAFLLFMDSCCFCQDCTGNRETCQQPHMARPAPEAMAVDVYTTVRQAGYEVNVLSDYNQKMDRFAFLMIR